MTGMTTDNKIVLSHACLIQLVAVFGTSSGVEM